MAGQVSAAGKGSQAAEESLLLGAEQVIAPRDGVTQGSLALRPASLPGLEFQAAVEAAEQGPRAEQPGPAAASSSASGRPSSCWQMAATSPEFSGVRRKSGRAIWAYRTNSSTAPGGWAAARGPDSGRGRSGYSCSPGTCSGRREVASTVTSGAALISSAVTWPAPGSCSRLSRTSRAC